MKDLLCKYYSAMLSSSRQKTRHIYLIEIKFKIGAENKGWIHTVENNRSIFQLIANWFCQLSWSSADCLGKGENVTWKSKNSNILFHSENFFMSHVREVNPNKAVLLRIFFFRRWVNLTVAPLLPPSPLPPPHQLYIFRRTNLKSILLWIIVKQPISSRLKVKKCWYHLLYVTSLVSLLQGNVKKSGKLMKVVNIDGENLYIFRTTSGISKKFPGKVGHTIILKVTKNQVFTLSLEDIVSEKTKGRGSIWQVPFKG